MKSFDELKNLYETDPTQFEQYRKQIIDELIDSAPEELQLKLKQIQWRVDNIVRTKPPLGAVVEISNMMWDTFYKLNELLKQVVESEKPINTPETKPTLKLVK